MYCTYFSLVNGSPEGARGDQFTSAAVHGQNHPEHPGPQPLHSRDKELAATQLEWAAFLILGEWGSFQLSDQSRVTWIRGKVYRKTEPVLRKQTCIAPCCLCQEERLFRMVEGDSVLNKREFSQPVIVHWLVMLLWLFYSFDHIFILSMLWAGVKVTRLISCENSRNIQCPTCFEDSLDLVHWTWKLEKKKRKCKQLYPEAVWHGVERHNKTVEQHDKQTLNPEWDRPGHCCQSLSACDDIFGQVCAERRSRSEAQAVRERKRVMPTL